MTRFLFPLILPVLLLCAPISSNAATESEDPLNREVIVRRTDDGIHLLNRLYWSPTLAIWLDRAGDDLRAHYEGRRNPPWWSSANAVEVLIDFMNATGTSEYDAPLKELYELHRERTGTESRLIAELKKRGQWNDEDEAKWRRKQSEAPPASGGGESYSQFRNEYLDDSGWWGVAWLKMYDRTSDKKYLSTAEAIHAHMAKNWRPDKGGGVLWCEDADKQRPNAITNSLFLILSSRLYERTKSPDYLKWADQTLEWFHDKALYDGSGIVDAPGHRGDYWTYNQGAYIGGLTALFLATGRQENLEEAFKVTESILHRSGVVRPDGVIIEKLGTKGWDPGLFKGIMARYLGQLRDALNSRKIEPAMALEINQCLRASAASLTAHSVAPDGQYTIAWQDGAKDTTANFNTQISALAALVAVLQNTTQ